MGKVAKTKAREKAKKWRLVEEEKKKKQLEYLKQLQDKVLAEDNALLGGTETSQVMGSKHKEVLNISLEDKAEQQLSKKTKRK